MTFNEWLKSKGMSTAVFSKKVDIDYPTIASWRRNESVNPRQIYKDKIIAAGFTDCPLVIRK